MTRLNRYLFGKYTLGKKSIYRRQSHKFSLWLAGLALAIGSLTLLQASNSNASPNDINKLNTLVSQSSNNSAASSSSDPKPNLSIVSHKSTSSSSDIVAPSNSPTFTTKLSVNGQSIPVPQNGSVKAIVPSNNGNPDVNVSVESSNEGSASSQSNTSSNISIYSHSTTLNSDSEVDGK